MHVFAWSADDALGVEGTLRCTECLTAHGQVELVAACDRQHVCEKVLWVRRRASAGPRALVRQHTHGAASASAGLDGVHTLNVVSTPIACSIDSRL